MNKTVSQSAMRYDICCDLVDYFKSLKQAWSVSNIYLIGDIESNFDLFSGLSGENNTQYSKRLPAKSVGSTSKVHSQSPNQFYAFWLCNP